MGDGDVIRPEHAAELVRLIPQAHLAILPNRDHITLMVRPEWMLAMIEEFLKAPLPTAA